MEVKSLLTPESRLFYRSSVLLSATSHEIEKSMLSFGEHYFAVRCIFHGKYVGLQKLAKVVNMPLRHCRL